MRSEPQGRLQVICGPMFAGKSEELQRRVRRAHIAGRSVEVVNHAWDSRHGTSEVSSHAGLSIPAHPASDVGSILQLVNGRPLDLLAVDEAQFFGSDLMFAVDDLVRAGTTVVVAGLCVTFDGRPFEPLASLMALAEDVAKLTAVCAVCGLDAAFHQRISPDAVTEATIPGPEHVGGLETYQARCRRHFEPIAAKGHLS
ncbi:thymidine kinase [Ornithinimicrobium cryptoxanthini]|uniref:thymidine kinase n=1 Tax=Ornithinimicrobium cryptoxanthini TaxID=2934161 RepID=UPI0021183687|nr:thymidine kinase [Ornithinimicrobium cryptoxanthini]